MYICFIIDISSNFFYGRKIWNALIYVVYAKYATKRTQVRKICICMKIPSFQQSFFLFLSDIFTTRLRCSVYTLFSEIITMLLESSRSKMWFQTNVVNPLCLLGLNSTNFVCISFELDSGQLLPRISIGSGIVCRVRHSKEE